MELEELVRRIRMGDKAAVKDLISIYGNSVYLRAFERTQDKELAREAARQTFGQFVAVVQQQSDEDGWSLWFGDLIERNISAYVQIAPDMNLIEDELERELYGEPEELPEPVSYQQPSARLAPPPQQQPQRQSSGRVVPAPEPADKASRSSGRSIRDEVFSESYRPRKKKKRSGGALSIILLILVCLILLWVVGGVAMTMKWIPEYDLGYTWFNTNVFKLF